MGGFPGARFPCRLVLVLSSVSVNKSGNVFPRLKLGNWLTVIAGLNHENIKKLYTIKKRLKKFNGCGLASLKSAILVHYLNFHYGTLLCGASDNFKNRARRHFDLALDSREAGRRDCPRFTYGSRIP